MGYTIEELHKDFPVTKYFPEDIQENISDIKNCDPYLFEYALKHLAIGYGLIPDAEATTTGFTLDEKENNENTTKCAEQHCSQLLAAASTITTFQEYTPLAK